MSLPSPAHHGRSRVTVEVVDTSKLPKFLLLSASAPRRFWLMLWMLVLMRSAGQLG